ncbi:MAG: hypothetical protein IKA87_00565 [Lentisphaeria bacterium]|nr:hypothetical protein [Lentisphaeria bacterium]
MKRFVVLGITAAVLGSMTLCGSSISSTKVEKISRIVRGEYGKVKSPMRPQKWQIYSNTNDPKIKNTIYATVKKQVVPFETKEKIVNISYKTRQAVNKKVAARFPYKTPEQITQGAIEEADRELPMVKVGDEITIRFYRNGIFNKITGKLQSIRDNGQVFEVKNQLVRVDEIHQADRKHFDATINSRERSKFIDYYKRNFTKIKSAYTTKLLADEYEKMTVNEKKGYIFFRGNWRTAKYVTDQLIPYYKKLIERRHAIEKGSFVKKGRGAAPAKKK